MATILSLCFSVITGVEPFSYYIINGFLNFNFVFLLALITVPVVEAKVLIK